jgi:protein TonB
MFDQLVESTKQRQGRRASRYFVVTVLIYAVAVLILAAGTIIGFSPVLAEGYSLKALLVPPPPTGPPPRAVIQNNNRATPAVNIFAPPTSELDRILPATEAARYPIAVAGQVVPGAPPGAGGGGYPPGPGETGDPVPPPPRPTPKIEPPSAPEINQTPRRVSGEVLQGKALRKVKPAYPAIARSIHANGPVQVMVMIAEDGRVIEATAISGNPVLRRAAVEAARQWLFTPTTLSNVPVKVQGLLTFNFIME